MKTTITLRHVGYYVEGVTDVTLWGGENACIQMRPFTLETLPTKKVLMENINDNGFGVQAINGALCSVHKLYEHRLRVWWKSVKVGHVSTHTHQYYEGWVS